MHNIKHKNVAGTLDGAISYNMLLLLVPTNDPYANTLTRATEIYNDVINIVDVRTNFLQLLYELFFISLQTGIKQNIDEYANINAAILLTRI